MAEIIERQCGMSFQEALEKYIFDPLDMKHTAVVASPDQIVKNRTESYAVRNGRYQKFEVSIMSNGSSGMRTTIKDFARWAKHFQATFQDNNSPFARMMQKSTLNSGDQIPYGLGLETKNYKGTQAVFHGGGTAGHRAYTLHIPEHNFSVFLLGNGNDYWPLKIAYQVVDIYLGDVLIEQVPTKNVSQSLDSYAGSYEYCPGNYYKFTHSNDSLYLEILGNPGKFYISPLGEHTFAYPFYPEAKFIFTKNRVDLHIADFVYTCAKVKPVLKEYPPEELSKLEGFYRNEEFKYDLRNCGRKRAIDGTTSH